MMGFEAPKPWKGQSGAGLIVVCVCLYVCVSPRSRSFFRPPQIGFFAKEEELIMKARTLGREKSRFFSVGDAPTCN